MGAVDTARAEAQLWVEIVGLAGEIDRAGVVPPAFEQRVTGFDPTSDLTRRASSWSHRLERGDLAGLARFAAGLAAAEAEGWERDDPVTATRSFADRRFLVSDRIAPWAIPWSDLVGRCHPDLREAGHRARDLLLTVSDDLRVAPWLTGDEGLAPPGEDSYGPRPPRLPSDLTVLGCGTVIFAATLTSMGGSGEVTSGERILDEVGQSDLVALFEITSGRWASLAGAHPGSARLWHDLAWRAEYTRKWLADRGTGAGAAGVLSR
jgi:hypothetical protein